MLVKNLNISKIFTISILINDQILQSTIESTLLRVKADYNANPRKYLTENDIVFQAYRHLQDEVLSDESKLSIHSELRPYKFEEKKGIHDNGWACLKQINHASKCDLAIVDSNKLYWNKTKKKIITLHSVKNPNKKKLRYWRFLIYPVEAFRAVFEFKMRVQGNLTNIREDIDKLVLIHEANPDCLTFMIILDRKASPKSMNTIREYSQMKGIQLLTHESIN